MIKICSKCNILKSIDQFRLIVKSKSSRRTYCKTCQQKVYKQWAEKNKEKLSAHNKEYMPKYWKRNCIELRPKRKEYYETCYRERHNLRRKERIRNEPEYRLKNVLRSRIGKFITGNDKSAKTMSLLGCNLNDLKIHLESKFKNGMSWKNYGRRGWHIDHIKPCTSFDLLNKEHQKQCFHYSNLQPLWWYENISKGNRT